MLCHHFMKTVFHDFVFQLKIRLTNNFAADNSRSRYLGHRLNTLITKSIELRKLIIHSPNKASIDSINRNVYLVFDRSADSELTDRKTKQFNAKNKQIVITSNIENLHQVWYDTDVIEKITSKWNNIWNYKNLENS